MGVLSNIGRRGFFKRIAQGVVAAAAAKSLPPVEAAPVEPIVEPIAAELIYPAAPGFGRAIGSVSCTIALDYSLRISEEERVQWALQSEAWQRMNRYSRGLDLGSRPFDPDLTIGGKLPD